MRNRIPTKVLDNGAIRYAVYDENGAFLRYEYMLPADDPTDPGTRLEKSTLLSDDVEALIWGVAADRTPNDAFGKVSELYQRWWSVLHGEAYSYWEEVRTPISAQVKVGNWNTTVYYSTALSIDSSGNFALVNPSELHVGDAREEHAAFCSNLAALAPVYIVPEDGEMYYLPAGVTQAVYDNDGAANNTTATIFGVFNTGDNDVYLNANAPTSIRASRVTTQRIDVPAGETTYVHSPDRNAYPDSGTVDGLTYKYLGVPFDNARTAPEIEIGSYAGAGVYDSANPNSLTFGFTPKYVLIRSLASGLYNDSKWVAVFPVCRLTDSFTGSSYKGWQYIGDSDSAPDTYSNGRSAKIVGNTLTWYTSKNSNGPREQLNESGTTYGYVAIK